MQNDIELAMSHNHSFWQFKYGDYTPNCQLEADQHSADLVIVGGGFTGLTTAREVLRRQPHLKVMVLEGHEVGFGASGRNGGFNMTLFGLEPEVTVQRWGKEKTKSAQAYMKQAVAYVKDLIEQEKLDSDYEHTGMWRVAYSDPQLKRLKKTYELLTELADEGDYMYLNQQLVQEKLNSPNIKGAIFEPGTGVLDPCKHVRNLKKLAEIAGANIYENTSVLKIQRNGSTIQVVTEHASIKTEKVVLATNAWGHLDLGLPRARNRQMPVWTYQIVTDPLTTEEWQTLNWADRMSIEDNRHMIHYMRLTKCGRITMGGGDVGLRYQKSRMDRWHDERIWHRLEQHFRWLFPSLMHKKVHYKWGGAVSVNLDMTPEIGFLGDQRIVFASGCMGHGVSLSQLNGKLIADLVLERDTQLSKFWIVNRKQISLPPGNFLSFAATTSVNNTLKAIDWYQERDIRAKT